MKLKTFIKKLQKIQDKHGNIDVTIHSENTDEGHTCAPCTITWLDKAKGNKSKATQVMICDAYTLTELG